MGKYGYAITSAIGFAGAAIELLFGEWTHGLTALVICMVIDFASGLIVAGVFKNSSKSENGALSSNATWKGICKKVFTLLLVVIAYYIDTVLGISLIKNAAIIALIAGEVISIIENMGLMGIKIPAIITKGIDLLNEKSKDDESSLDK